MNGFFGFNCTFVVGMMFFAVLSAYLGSYLPILIFLGASYGSSILGKK